MTERINEGGANQCIWFEAFEYAHRKGIGRWVITRVGKAREIVIEIERVQLIRKRAKTKFRHCGLCQAETDFVSLRDAAELFERKIEDLLLFLRTNDCHYREESNGKIEICLSIFLKAIDARVKNPMRLLGD